MRWLRPGEVPTLGHWFRAAGYDTHYDGKWHISPRRPAPIRRRASRWPPTTTTASSIDRRRAGLPRRRPARPVRVLRLGRPRAPRRRAGQQRRCGRDPLIADRVVAWLEDRYARRRAGDADALRPFLLVASFVNPHDIVLFPMWVPRQPAAEPVAARPAARARRPHRRRGPGGPSRPRRSPTARPTTRGYGPAAAVERIYRTQRPAATATCTTGCTPRSTRPLDRVRRAVTDGGSDHAVLVRTSDHGDLLGAHGGLHQKWFNLYDEATRVPFIDRPGRGERPPARRDGRRRPDLARRPACRPCSAAAGIDEAATAAAAARDRSPRCTRCPVAT